MSEHVIEPEVVPPQEHTPVMEEKDKPQDDSAPTDKEQPNLMAESNIIDLFVSMEDL